MQGSLSRMMPFDNCGADKSQPTGGCQELGMGRDGTWGTGSPCGLMKRSGAQRLWSHHVANATNATELCTLKCLQW